MKNAKKWLGVFVIVMLISVFSVGLVACNKTHFDNESTTFAMSIQNPDGVFNPFFSTSAYDSSVISLTQISMFNTDKKGNLITGLDQPTVALDYVTQATDSEHNPVEDESIAAQNGYTDYDILIKNGIKFSDGHDLTIKDVLFNLYVYLDPVFTGSATIYSTDIVGLNAYRTQEEDLSEEGMNRFEEKFSAGAYTYLTQLVAWVNKYTGVDDDKNPNAPSSWTGHKWNDDFEYKMDQSLDELVDVSFADLRTKINHIAALYHDELVSDWNAINMEDYEKWPDFTQPWQVFLLNDMGATEILKTLDGSQTLDKTEDGTYKLNVDEANAQYQDIINEYKNGIINSMSDGPDKDNAIRDAFVNAQFETVFGNVAKDANGDYVKDKDGNYSVSVPSVNRSLFEEVVNFWGTASTLMDELVAEVKTNYFAGSEQGLKVPNITGIWAYKTSKFNGKQLNGEHYVLHIRINKVDPKALMNFAFTVAPMHYYSNDAQVKLVNDDWAAWEAAGAEPAEFNDYVTHFGLKYADSKFMNEEINASTKIVKPLGAGVYQASNFDGDENFGDVTGGGSDGFFNNNMIFYTRNNYFWTVGADGGSQANSQLQNAKIKHVAYKVVAADQIIASLKRGDIQFGDPSATQKNQQELLDAGLTVVKTKTSGYGYIGVNPRYVPEHQVRQAIMKAMNIDDLMIADYYEGGFADRIYRPMTNTIWAYTDTGELLNDPEPYKYDATGMEIEKLVEDAGYEKVNGLYTNSAGKTLDFKFTIAGGSTDHPAYNCFLNAQKLLNDHGFNVQVVTSAQALSDLSAGKLAVWAAAWSSAIDPDMYQVYHINSQASSTSNWGYKQIKADKVKYKYEYDIITILSDEIDAARETTNQDERADHYANCLDYVMELAVELPTYNRYDISSYNKNVIDANSLPKHNTGNDATDEVSSYYGLLSRIWEVSFV